MAKPVNLRTVRRQRVRDAARCEADAAAARRAGPAAEAARLRAEAERARRRLDAHRRDDGPDGTE
jgi:hypothetical protein